MMPNPNWVMTAIRWLFQKSEVISKFRSDIRPILFLLYLFLHLFYIHFVYCLYTKIGLDRIAISLYKRDENLIQKSISSTWTRINMGFQFLYLNVQNMPINVRRLIREQQSDVKHVK